MKKRLQILFALVSVGMTSGALAQQSLSWSEVFQHEGKIPSISLQASYRDAQGEPHSIRLWRSSDHWVHRQTDGLVDVYAKSTGNRVYFRLVDHRKKQVVDSERTSLFKVGLFLDWRHLATGLSLPDAAVQLTSVRGNKTVTAVPCQWVQATLPGQDQPYQLCWSSRYNSLIALQARQHDGQWVSLYTVTALQSVSAVSESWPDIPAGYEYQNVDADLQAD